MSDKLKDVRGKKPSEDEIVNYEETRDTKEPELEPDPSVVVATGDEQHPVSSSDPKEARKALYEKARKRREETVSRESDEHLDIAQLQAMQAEASGGEKPETGLDTNRKDRFDEDVADERREAAELMKKAQEEAQQKKEEESTKKDSGSAEDALTETDPDAKVTVKILGKEYSVPQQDIDDAGGLEVYQKSRAATLRLQRIATLDRALPPQKQEEPARGEQQEADPSTDGLDEADISSLREKLLDAMVDGEDLEAVDKVLKDALTSRRTKPKPQPKPQQSEISATEQQIIREAQAELAAQQEDDRRAANDMMRQQYSDIMGDPELLALAQQRFAMIAAHADNQGRTQKELARESAEYVRSLGKRLLIERSNQTSDIEAERKRRIDRKKRLPQASRADAPAPQAQSQERKIPSRKEHLARLRRRAGLDLTE